MWSWVARSCQHIKHLQWFISPRFEELLLGWKQGEKEGTRHPTCQSSAEWHQTPRAGQVHGRGRATSCPVQHPVSRGKGHKPSYSLCSAPLQHPQSLPDWSNPSPAAVSVWFVHETAQSFWAFQYNLPPQPLKQTNPRVYYLLKLVTFPTNLYYLIWCVYFYFNPGRYLVKWWKSGLHLEIIYVNW